jgi:hypothetical protein
LALNLIGCQNFKVPDARAHTVQKRFRRATSRDIGLHGSNETAGIASEEKTQSTASRLTAILGLRDTQASLSVSQLRRKPLTLEIVLLLKTGKPLLLIRDLELSSLKVRLSEHDIALLNEARVPLGVRGVQDSKETNGSRNNQGSAGRHWLLHKNAEEE